MRIISPIMERISSVVARTVDDLRSPVPRAVQDAMRRERGLPGLTQDPVLVISA